MGPTASRRVGLVSQFIPTIGAHLADALPRLIAFTVDLWYALWVLVCVVLYQQFETSMLQPELSTRSVDIHPAGAFGSVVAGTTLLGVVGALISITAVATLQVFLGAHVKRYDVTDDSRGSPGECRPEPGAEHGGRVAAYGDVDDPPLCGIAP